LGGKYRKRQIRAIHRDLPRNRPRKRASRSVTRSQRRPIRQFPREQQAPRGREPARLSWRRALGRAGSGVRARRQERCERGCACRRVAWFCPTRARRGCVLEHAHIGASQDLRCQRIRYAPQVCSGCAPYPFGSDPRPAATHERVVGAAVPCVTTNRAGVGRGSGGARAVERAERRAARWRGPARRGHAGCLRVRGTCWGDCRAAPPRHSSGPCRSPRGRRGSSTGTAELVGSDVGRRI
jgi:hypothetical protein